MAMDIGGRQAGAPVSIRKGLYISIIHPFCSSTSQKESNSWNTLGHVGVGHSDHLMESGEVRMQICEHLCK
jgi:hypothetical protein